MGEKVSVGIIGATGYTGAELIRLLLRHPQVELSSVYSRSKAGLPLTDIHDDLLGQTDLCFTDKVDPGCDVYFLCLPHGEAVNFLESSSELQNKRIIDLSNDFRSSSKKNPFIYGLPELNRSRLHKAYRIANPGCFATAVQLALLPLAFHRKLNTAVHVSAITGSTGAGSSLLETTHFSWRNNNVSVYKAFTHQHLAEIRQSLTQLQGSSPPEVNFIPYRGNFSRGIIASVYLEAAEHLNSLKKFYRDYYQTHPFVKISEKELHLKQVVNTNFCYLHLSKHDGKLLVVSIIDNLLKGASGQAVQNLNLMYGWNETLGLDLKSIAY